METTTQLTKRGEISSRPAIAPRDGTRNRKLAHEMIEAHARLNPTHLALVAADRHLNYGALNDWANEVAGQLTEIGIGPECVVSILLPRSIEFVVAILAVLKCGAAFNPLEPSWPQQRIRLLLREASSRCVITSRVVLEGNKPDGTQILLLDGEKTPEKRRHQVRGGQVFPQNLAYVLFTSGSTGTPKPVGVEHGNLSNYVSSILDVLHPLPGSKFVLMTSFAADLSYTVVFPSLCSGGTLHVIPAESVLSLDALRTHLSQRPPDFMKITPSLAAALLSGEEAECLLPRQCLVLGGERLTWPVVDKIRELAPNLRVLNHYGPTETTVGVLVGPGTEANGTASVPLGRAIANTQVHLLDPAMNPVPAGGEGEIYIGGESVSRGYLGRPDLTASQFVPDPSGTTEGGRLYRTGDIALQLETGEVEFRSRADGQIKVRGHRVEPGEIEAVISQHPGVVRTAVIQKESEDGSLVAFIEGRSEEVYSKALRQWLAERLPDYMVPENFIVVSTMPTLASGKIDRQALGSQSAATLQPLEAQPETPQPTEERILTIWRKVLKLQTIGTTQKFFDIGGNSLRLIQLQSELKREFGKSVPVGTLFAHPTIRDLAQHLFDDAPPVESSGERAGQTRRVALTKLAARYARGKESL